MLIIREAEMLMQERTPGFYLCHFPFAQVLVYTRFFIKWKRDNDAHVKSVRTTKEIPVERYNNQQQQQQRLQQQHLQQIFWL
jgi:hypothetical protein